MSGAIPLAPSAVERFPPPVTTLGYKLIFRRSCPVIADKFNLPTRQQIDMRLVSGAVLFGVGWGLAGICPGPALADLVTLEPKILLFVTAMLMGMILANAWQHQLFEAKALRQQD